MLRGSTLLFKAKLTAGLHTSAARAAITKFNLPAMSPTMTEGTIHQWKIKEGQAFSAGDILLELETDKAQIDVEAPEDGVLAKIVLGDGQKGEVNSLIALLAEEGDDLSNIEVPQDEPAPAAAAPAQEEKKEERAAPSVSAPSTPMDHHDLDTSKLKKPLGPAVLSLVLRHHIKDLDAIKASGPGGRILKGDVLAHLGLIAPKPAPKPTLSVAPPRDQIEFAKPKEEPKSAGKAKKEDIPVVPDYIERQITLDALLGFREATNATVNDLIAQAATRALQEVHGAKLRGGSKDIVYQTSASSYAPTYRGGEFKIFHLAPPTYDFITDSYVGSKPFVLHVNGVQKRKVASQPETMVDILDFLGGGKGRAAPRSTVSLQRKATSALPAQAQYQVDFKLQGNKQITANKDAKVFLDRLEYYIRHPEELAA
ncbi:hypothetical protein BC940DRAFT_308472 [Gongronella butleri]|nr:hypothetical protein BC940DRAFT_308472 [Gongronella butleri]